MVAEFALTTQSLFETHPSCARLARFRIKSFENEAVVFDTASGDTHLLAPFTLTLFELIQSNPGLSTHEIESALLSKLALPSSAHLTSLTQESVAGLRQLGLLEAP